MLFNGLMCGDSDTSDVTKESGVSSPGCDVDSVAIGGACDAARAQYYHSKLLATLQILANKEETVRVQGESLAVAEARLAAVSARALRLRQQLDQRAQEITNLQCDVKCKKPCKKSDFSMCIQTETTEVEKLKEMVRTLQSNLSVIEELYRECFYEAAKQEDTIELLRDACAELRRRERGGARGQPGTAGNCHGKDVAAEVENLKREISDFLNSSNNDSGVWESPGADVAGELRDIMAQLAQLQGILSQECNCDLEEENAQLKKINETMKMQLGCQRQALQELECQLKAKSCETCHLAKQGAGKDEQITCMKRKMECLNQELCEKTETLCCLKSKLEKTQECLSARTAEAACGESRRAAAEECADALRGELEKANRELQEMCSVREEVRRLSTAVAAWRAQLADSERRAASLQCELEQARDHCRQLDACYREKASASCALQAQLEEAHARGAALCAEARRVVCAVRRWVRDMRRTHCIQEEKIKEQQAQICGLRCQLASQPPPCPPPPCPPPPCSACPVPPCGSTYLPSPSPPCSPRLCSPPCSPKPSCASAAARDAACAKCARRTGGDSIGCSKCARKSRDSTCFMAPSVRTRWPAAAKSETVQCERPPGARERATSPVPPRRVLRKKRVCGDERCVGACGRVDASAGPRRSDAAVGPPDAAPRRPPAPAAPAGAPPARPASPSPPRCTHRTHSAASRPVTRVVSPSQELLERVDKLQESLEVSQRRWQRARRPAPPAPPAATLIAHEDNDSA